MIAENPYHRRKIKRTLKEKKLLEAQVAELREENNVLKKTITILKRKLTIAERANNAD